MNQLIAIVGPTGVGKTRLGIQLAKNFNGEIVNADSRQVYRYMDIGTAKPTQAEQTSVPHHLIDIINPDVEFSLAIHQRLALGAIRDILKRGRLPFLVGGTGQYVWAILEGWVIPAVAPDIEFRRSLEKLVTDGGAVQLYRQLQNTDPVVAEKIDPRNIRRVIRALEVIHTSNKNFSELRKKNPPPFKSHIVGLTMERQALYRCVDERVDNMIEQGLVEEVKRLLEMGYSSSSPSMSGIGYGSIASYLRGDITLSDAIEKIKTGTHRFIRHQYAWFGLKDPRIKWFDAEDTAAVVNFVRGLIGD